MPQLDRIINQLWELGAAQESVQFPAWLLCAPTNAFMKSLLDKGVNPHVESIQSFNRNQVLSIEPLLKKLLKLEDRALLDKIKSAGDQSIIDQNIGDLVLIIDRVLASPGASQYTLDKNLGLITQYAFESHPHHIQKNRWPVWRDALLSQGAVPSFGPGGALKNLCFASPKRGLSLDDFLYLKRENEDREDASERADQFLEQADLDWRERSIEWMRTLASKFIERNPDPKQSLSNPGDTSQLPLDQYTWERLISFPNGLDLAQELIKTSIEFPWERFERNQRQSGFAYLQAKPSVVLNRFAALLRDRPVHKEWSNAQASAYINRAAPSRRRPDMDEVLTQDEISDLFEISRMER